MNDIKKWHEKIPPNGVLCKEKISNHIVRIMKKSEYYDGLVLDDCFRENLFDIDELTPLTAAEIWDLMPWQPMDNAPTETPIFIIANNVFQQSIFAVNDDSELYDWETKEAYAHTIDCDKWLPMP